MTISAIVLKPPPCQTWGIFMQTDRLSWLTFRGYLCNWHGYFSAKFGINFSDSSNIWRVALTGLHENNNVIVVQASRYRFMTSLFVLMIVWFRLWILYSYWLQLGWHKDLSTRKSDIHRGRRPRWISLLRVDKFLCQPKSMSIIVLLYDFVFGLRVKSLLSVLQ